MSTLLDVLHKRPSRAQLAAAAATADAEVDSTPPEVPPGELRLAPEFEPGLATQAGQPAAAPAGEALPGPSPVRPPESPPAAGATTQMRRWSDAMASRDPEPVRAEAGARPSASRRRPLLLVLCAAAAAFAAFLVYEFAGQEAESFLAAPDGVLPAPAAPLAAAQSAAPAAATPVARPVRKVPRPPVAEPDTAPVDIAWYDQPALPAGASGGVVEPLIQITRGVAPDPLFDTLRDAYAALQAGDGPRAESLYRAALATHAGSVDALLGLATLANRGGRTEEARDLYRQVQRLDPKNATAAAALSALPGASARTGTESQLKGMLREQPASGALHFALGLRYVGQQRWPDAQLAFFEAVRHEPANADYAFNLAVSLDQLGQAMPAASYYQRAIELATGSQQFDVAAARARLEALRPGQG